MLKNKSIQDNKKYKYEYIHILCNLNIKNIQISANKAKKMMRLRGWIIQWKILLLWSQKDLALGLDGQNWPFTFQGSAQLQSERGVSRMQVIAGEIKGTKE